MQLYQLHSYNLKWLEDYIKMLSYFAEDNF